MQMQTDFCTVHRRKFIREYGCGICKQKSYVIEESRIPDNLYAFQREGVKFIAQCGDKYLADEMGLGKTIQTLAFVKSANVKSTLVVCPKSVVRNWEVEIEKWAADSSVKVVPYSQLSKLDFSIEYELLVLDESHYIKNYKSQRSSLVAKIKAGKRLLLSGTPVMNRPIDLFNQLRLMNSEIAKNFYKFSDEYLITNERFGQVIGYKNLDKLGKELDRTVMLRRTKKQVSIDIPDKIRIFSYVSENLALGEEELIGQLDSKEKIAFDQLSECRHKSVLAKLDECVEFIENYVQQTEVEEKIVIFAHHQDVITKLVEKFNAVKIDGQMSSEERMQALDKWEKVLVVSIQAGGIGLNLTKASTAFFVEEDWNYSTTVQAEDRLNRIGAKNTTMIYHLLSKDSLDDYMLKRIFNKKEESKELESQVVK